MITPTPVPDFYAEGPATVECVITAANKQQVPANVLLAIGSIESGKNGQTVKNNNGSIDHGHFQLNTIQFRQGGRLEPLIKKGVTLRDVTWRGCYNAELAAYVLKGHLAEETGQDFWTKAANYHSKTGKFNAIYKSKLIPLSTQWAKWLQQNYQNIQVSYR